MQSENRTVVYIIFSILILPLIATIFAMGILLFVETDQFQVNTAAQTATVDVLYHAGINAYESGNYEVAEARFREALLLMPESAALHSKLGMTLIEQGRSGEAQLAVQKAIALNPALVGQTAINGSGAANCLVQSQAQLC